jgi:hypothetical protein
MYDILQQFRKTYNKYIFSHAPKKTNAPNLKTKSRSNKNAIVKQYISASIQNSIRRMEQLYNDPHYKIKHVLGTNNNSKFKLFFFVSFIASSFLSSIFVKRFVMKR